MGIFITALYLGYRMGFNSPAPVLPAEAKKPALPTLANPVIVLPNGQISLLLVTVDDLLSARPRLESVWLVELVPPDPRLTLLSVYPSFNTVDAKQDNKLASAFLVEVSGDNLQIGESFLKALQDRKLFWSGAILLDKYALAQSLDYFNQPQPEKSLSEQQVKQSLDLPNGSTKVVDLASSSQNPQMALFGQAAVFQELCQSISQRNPILDEAGQEELAKLLQGHFYPDLDPRLVLPPLKAYQSAGSGIFCVFPTLPIQSMSSR
jgi:hypothetical protein